jgi:competence protein ComEC
LPIVVVAGAAWTSHVVATRLADRLDEGLVGTDVTVRGFVDDFPKSAPGQTSFSFTVSDSIASAALPARLRLTWYEPPLALEPAMSLELTLRLKPPHGLMNPGAFDFERWLFVGGFGATGYVRSGHPAETVPSLRRAWLELRRKLAAKIAAAVESDDARALLIALAIGERSGFTDRHWQTFRRTGTSHLVAISGLHIGIVATWLFLLIRRLCLRGSSWLAAHDLEIAAAVSLAGAALYAAIAGFSVPTQRALIMVTVAMLALVSRRQVAPSAGLGAALLFVLVCDPLAPIGASFWLSFVAVAVLLTLGMQRSLAPRRAWTVRVTAALRTQWAVSLGLLPFAALYFGEVSLLAPIVNLVAIPLFALLLVPLTLVATVVLAISPVGGGLLSLLAPLADAIYAALEAVAAFGWSLVTLFDLGIVSRGLLIVAAALALPVHRLPSRYLGSLAAVAVLVVAPARPSAGSLRLTIFDVGHGLAALVETQAHTLLFDTGARYRSGFDAGRDIVLPALRRQGIDRLDAIIVSHADNDHAGGLDAIRQRFPETLLATGPDLQRPDATACRSGDAWLWEGVRFSILHPPNGHGLTGNDGSCVLRVESGGGSVLLTGDIEHRGEAALVSSAAELAATVVVVPHHGSSTSSTAAFVERVMPQYAIVSAGYLNRWGFPKPEVVDRWRRSGGRVLITSELGAIHVTIASDGRTRVRSERSARAYSWNPGFDS